MPVAFYAKWWTCDEVAQWLKDIGFDGYVDFFYDNQIDGRVLLSLTKEDLFVLVKVFGDIFKLSNVLDFEGNLARLKEARCQDFVFPAEQPADVPQEPLVVSNEANWKEGGYEENIRVMEEAFPDYCWRYKSVDVLFKDFVPMTKGEASSANAFPALTTHIISPVDFYAQPNLIQPMVRKMQDQLQDTYSESTSAVPRENIFVGMPCVTKYKEDDNWYRAQVVDVVGSEEAPVRFIDYGNRQYSCFEDLKPLKKEFGRLPPASLQCRIKGVRERTLEQKVLEAFRSEIESLGCEVLVSIVSSTSEPFLVDVFNKYNNENIGVKYLPKEPICPKLPPMDALKKKKEREKVANEEAASAAINGEGGTKVFASDMDAFLCGELAMNSSSSDDGYTGEIKRTNKKIRKFQHEEKLQAQRKWPPKNAEEEERFRAVKLPNMEFSIQRRFRKQKKPLIGAVEVRIAHVESTKEIYVRILTLENLCGDVKRALWEVYADTTTPVPSLPPEYMTMEGACVIYEPKAKTWLRCRIVDVSNNGVVLQSVDFGKRLPVIPPSEYDRMKCLLSKSVLDAPPQAFWCRIDQLCENQPTPTETRLLQEMLPLGSIKKAEFERSREPYRIRLWDPATDERFEEQFVKVLDERSLREVIECERRPCTDVAVWQDPKHVDPPAVRKEEQRRESSSKSATNVSSVEGKAAANGGTAVVVGGKENATKPTYGVVNDIEAVLHGSVTAAGYDSDEDVKQHSSRVATGRGGGRRVDRITDLEEDDQDEKGSICDFSDEKKQLVSKWLERSVAASTAPSAAHTHTGPRPQSAAASYNPDLKPMGQRSVFQMQAAKAVKGTKSVHGDASVGMKRDAKVRMPVQSAQVLKDLGAATPQQ